MKKLLSILLQIGLPIIFLLLSTVWPFALYLFGISIAAIIVWRIYKAWRYFMGLKPWLRYPLLAVIGGGILYFLIWLFTSGVVNVRTVTPLTDDMGELLNRELTEQEVAMTEAFKSYGGPEAISLDFEVYSNGGGYPTNDQHEGYAQILRRISRDFDIENQAKTGGLYVYYQGRKVVNKRSGMEITSAYVAYIKDGVGPANQGQLIDDWLYFQGPQTIDSATEEYVLVLVTTQPIDRRLE